ncbi:hypothetical protein D3C84_970390 [compost metagenome]
MQYASHCQRFTCKVNGFLVKLASAYARYGTDRVSFDPALCWFSSMADALVNVCDEPDELAAARFPAPNHLLVFAEFWLCACSEAF